MRNILRKADRITSGIKRKAYGHPKENFKRTAALWSAILGVEVSSQQVALCMVAFKLAREAFRHKEDNLVDAVGYLVNLDMLYEV